MNEILSHKKRRISINLHELNSDRFCPGYHFAQYEANLFIAGIIQLCKMTLVDPTIEVVPVYALITSPKVSIVEY